LKELKVDETQLKRLKKKHLKADGKPERGIKTASKLVSITIKLIFINLI